MNLPCKVKENTRLVLRIKRFPCIAEFGRCTSRCSPHLTASSKEPTFIFVTRAST